MNTAAKVLYLKPARLKATGVTGEPKHWWRPRAAPHTFTKSEIESACLKSQQMKIDAYKQAQAALKKPFSV